MKNTQEIKEKIAVANALEDEIDNLIKAFNKNQREVYDPKGFIQAVRTGRNLLIYTDQWSKLEPMPL